MGDMDDIFYNLPDDPEAAFVILEQEFRSEYQGEIEKADNNSWADEARLKYAGQVRAALEELSIDFEFYLPEFTDGQMDYNRFQTFRRDIESLATKIRIRTARARVQNSVRLDPNTKSKLRQLLEKIKETILELDESDSKREALLRKVAALEAEINRDRTRFEVAAALWIGLCEKTGEGLEKLEPARKWIDSVAGFLAQAKSLETPSLTLPKRAPPARIERYEKPIDRRMDEVEEDIPF